MSNTSLPRAGARRLPARIMVAAAAAALPMGAVAAPVLAAPVVVAQDEQWQEDCDHTGNFSLQPERGQIQWSDCDVNGQWAQADARPHGPGGPGGPGGWNWKHIIPPNPWWTWIPGNWWSGNWWSGSFGSF